MPSSSSWTTWASHILSYRVFDMAILSERKNCWSAAWPCPTRGRAGRAALSEVAPARSGFHAESAEAGVRDRSYRRNVACGVNTRVSGLWQRVGGHLHHKGGFPTIPAALHAGRLRKPDAGVILKKSTRNRRTGLCLTPNRPQPLIAHPQLEILSTATRSWRWFCPHLTMTRQRRSCR